MEHDLLDTIEGPGDLKTSIMPSCGSAGRGDQAAHHRGHFGPRRPPGLQPGAVEITIALHRSSESPRDKIIWDVSHQAYAHKLLTGRNHDFDTLRQQGGICGFTRRGESESRLHRRGACQHLHQLRAGLRLEPTCGTRTITWWRSRETGP